jgi:hypothetical protein
MNFKKTGLFLFLQVTALLLGSTGYSQSIKNTKKFLEYFNGVDNTVSYKKMHENIQNEGKKIQASASISDDDKKVLEDFYDRVKAKADSLVDKITSDLLSKSERKRMVKDPDAYVTSLNGIFEDIKTTDVDFENKYAEIAGATRGKNFSWKVKTFQLPLDKEFENELITALLKALIKNQVEKKISIKAWDDL